MMNNTLLNTAYFLAKQFEKVAKGAKGEIIRKGLITTLVECIEGSWKISFWCADKGSKFIFVNFLSNFATHLNVTE